MIKLVQNPMYYIVTLTFVYIANLPRLPLHMSKPISMVKLNSYFVMPKCIISEYITQKMYNSVTKWCIPLRNCNGVVATE